MERIARRTWLVAAGLGLGALAITWSAPARADEYTDTINVFRKAQESGRFFAHAHGYAVFPTIGKGGAGIGGAYGKGRVYEKGKVIGDATMTQVSIGLQLGGQGYSEIVFFEDAAALKRFTAGDFQFGAEASAVALTAGANAQAGQGGATAAASLDKNKAKAVGAYHDGMAVFTIAKGGLMYEVAVAGQKYGFKRH
jgi:lipid-binding SYLF domain-containing protein